MVNTIRVTHCYKTELVWSQGPWDNAARLELATAAWVAWWNTARLHGALGWVPPAEYERNVTPANAAPAA